MAILRKQKTSNFTTVNNYFINDINLKPDGKGFLLFMLSKPDDLLIKKENLPYVPSGYMASGNAVNGNIYQNTDITKTDLTKDNIDYIDKTKILHHKALINELIREGVFFEKKHFFGCY